MGVKSLEFEVVAEEGAARRGLIRTPHGILETPGFFAVATRGALKSLDPEAARRSGVQALIANTYHLEMQPGAESVAAAGGLHRLMAWNGVLATDSGGFQVFSFRHGQVADEVKGRRRLPTAIGPAERGEEAIEPVRVDEDGVDFRSYIDGARHRFTPESCIARQRDLGADVCFALDECTPFHVPEEYTRAATERNLRWARRCAEAFAALGMERSQAFFGIVHGGVYPELRRWSAAERGGAARGRHLRLRDADADRAPRPVAAQRPAALPARPDGARDGQGSAPARGRLRLLALLALHARVRPSPVSRP
jgi:queuine tRNA-ribosyltransferase